jgi:isoleucyl-tRNA synthetase
MDGLEELHSEVKELESKLDRLRPEVIDQKCIYALWDELNIVKQWLTKEGEEFQFMDGPPFVSAKILHMGHFLVGYIKSTILYHERMNGKKPLIKLGYDTHGLPIEQEVNRELGLKTPEDMEKYGLAEYNKKCKETISEYSGAWEKIYHDMGRWTEPTNIYKTMDTPFMESVWWGFKQLFDKGLIYHGRKILSYSWACATSLSNSEAGLNYKMITDSAIYVAFQLKETPNEYIVAWTTTPWTLPGNLALCVHPDGEYVKVKPDDSDHTLIMMKSIVKKVLGKKPFTVTGTVVGKSLANLKYIPLYSFPGKSYKVIADKFVQIGDSLVGSGIVHIAPAYGEDDYRICQDNNIIAKDGSDIIDSLDRNGTFVGFPEFLNDVHFVDANKLVIKDLKERSLLIKRESHRHSYPFCWRTDTPLIYRAMDGVFVNIEKLKDRMIENNKKISWFPGFVGKERFHQWLVSSRDWNVSRRRSFGTPIPLFMSEDKEEVVCVGSIDELCELAGLEKRPTDIHREFIDHITIPSKMGKGELKPLCEVFDCWFESGSVPYAQHHYPFEPETIGMFDGKEFLTDFICEGLDQTRGWFYTLLALSTALFDKPPCKTIMCTGLLLSSEMEGGSHKKISKRDKNYKDPLQIVKEFGSDVLRASLLSTPAIRAEPCIFDETQVMKTYRILGPLYNAHKYYLEKASMYMFETEGTTEFDPWSISLPEKLCDMDIWILGEMKSIHDEIKILMSKYRIDQVYHRIYISIDLLTNYYIKLNKNRIRGKSVSKESRLVSLLVLHRTLFNFAITISPFLPCYSEIIYQKLKDKTHPESVHLFEYSGIDTEMFDSSADISKYAQVYNDITELNKIIYCLRKARNSVDEISSGKTPINRITIVTTKLSDVDALIELNQYIKDEINVLSINYAPPHGIIEYIATPNRGTIGKQFKKDSKKVLKALGEYDGEITKDLTLTIDDKTFKLNEEHFTWAPHVNESFDMSPQTKMVSVDKYCIFIDTTITDEIIEMRKVRTFGRAIQVLRQKTELRPWDAIIIVCKTNDEELKMFVNKNKLSIENIIDKRIIVANVSESDKSILVIEELVDIECFDNKIMFAIEKFE